MSEYPECAECKKRVLELHTKEDNTIAKLWEIESLRIFAMHEALSQVNRVCEEGLLTIKAYDRIRLRLEERFELNRSGIREVVKKKASRNPGSLKIDANIAFPIFEKNLKKEGLK